MKKLFLLGLFLCITGIIKSQVIIIEGVGVTGKNQQTLSYEFSNQITRIDAFVFEKNNVSDAPPPINSVYFNNSFNERPAVIFDPLNFAYSSRDDHSIGLYRSTFNTIDPNGIVGYFDSDYAISLVAFLYDENLTLRYRSYLANDFVYFYKNGSSNAKVFSIPIEKASSSRNILVKLPISDLDDTDRIAIIDIEAGPRTLHVEEKTFNYGESFFKGQYMINNVPGNVSEVKISVYSPDSNEGNGDSFFINGVIVDVEKEFTGCTLTQGYWKTHSICKPGNGKGPVRDSTWDLIPGGNAENSMFFLSNQDYCAVYDTKPGKGGKYYILAHQYIAAQLNLLADADPIDITDAFNEATDFFEEYTPQQVKGNKSLEAKAVELGGILDDFNNGRIGPGHCDDSSEHEDDEVYIEPIKRERSKSFVYPNPASEKGKITFVSKQTGHSSVELFNIHGQKVGTFFKSKIKKGDEVEIEYDASRLPEGIYFAIIKNGTDTYKEKISITN